MTTVRLDVDQEPRPKGPWYLEVYKPMTKLTLIRGGQSLKHYTPKINSNTTPRTAA